MNRRTVTASTGCAAALALLLVVHARADEGALAVAGRANSTPSIAADGSTVAVAWGAMVPGGAVDVYAAVSADGGKTFGSPVRVNDVDGDAKLGGEQPPRVALHGRTMTVVWTTK